MDPQRIEETKASLMARVEELGRRIRDAREKFDVPAHIAAHPLAATGIAFALGLLIGGRGRARRARTEEDAEIVKRSLSGALFTALGAVAIRLAKDIALRQFADSAMQWWDQRSSQVSEREARASEDASVEAFVEH